MEHSGIVGTQALAARCRWLCPHYQQAEKTVPFVMHPKRIMARKPGNWVPVQENSCGVEKNVRFPLYVSFIAICTAFLFASQKPSHRLLS